MKICLIKLSSLGDVVHTLPVVHDILQSHPQAQIDWVVDEAFAGVLTSIEGLHAVHSAPLRKWLKKPWRYAVPTFKFLKGLRRVEYDTIIDLQGLTKSALVSFFLKGKKYAFANQTQGSSYEAPTKWVAHQTIEMPYAISATHRARLMCSKVLNYEETSLGQTPPYYGFDPLARMPKPIVALCHGSSRENKQWAENLWIELAQHLHAQGFVVVLPHGNDQEMRRSKRLTERMRAKGVLVHVWPRLSLDKLVLKLADCAGCIGVDSGLTHLAVALNLPTVQIYNFDTAWRTGAHAFDSQKVLDRDKPLPFTQYSVFSEPTPSLDTVWHAWCEAYAADQYAKIQRIKRQYALGAWTEPDTLQSADEYFKNTTIFQYSQF